MSTSQSIRRQLIDQWWIEYFKYIRLSSAITDNDQLIDICHQAMNKLVDQLQLLQTVEQRLEVINLQLEQYRKLNQFWEKVPKVESQTKRPGNRWLP